MENKYYTPEIEEFHIGFECEVYITKQRHGYIKQVEDNTIINSDSKYYPITFGNKNTNYELLVLGELMHKGELNINKFRVKYLDKEDIESLGFNNNDVKLANHIKPESSLYKILEDDTIFTIQWYWHMLRNERENLIRIFKGTLHKYPYQEIFRGDIKNKSELKILLKQLNIDEN
tara:strand:- start:1788 stop:2312 length:525 start_codon:yes stop_codon:yes gene_type:complete